MVAMPCLSTFYPALECARPVEGYDFGRLVPLQLQDPTALPGFAVRHRKYLAETLETLDNYCRKLLLTSHPCARNGLCSSYRLCCMNRLKLIVPYCLMLRR